MRARVAILASVFAVGLLYVVASAQVSVPGTRVVPNHRSLNAASTDETAGTALGPELITACQETAAYVVWATGTTAGGVAVETAHETGYTGTWANLATVTFSGTAPKVDVVQITGAHTALRTRVDTAVSDGTVTTFFTCS